MKFIHAADLHLDTPFVSIQNFSKQLQNDLRKSTYSAATKVFNTAVRQHVDFVLLAGDTYDNTERSLNAQEFLKNQFQRLKDNDIQVYLIYGNHDYYRNDFSAIKFPSNVHVFSDKVSTEILNTHDGTKVGISGFSYYKQHIEEDKVGEFPARENVDYQIGMLHGSQGISGEYAPFSLDGLNSKAYDYWALGHIHKREILQRDPYIVYPGDTQGRNLNETGMKGFYVVSVVNQQSQLEFIPSSTYVWERTSVLVDQADTLDSLNQRITTNLAVDVPTLFTIEFSNAQRLNPEIIRSIERGDLLNYLPQTELGVVYRIDLNYQPEKKLDSIDQRYWDDAAEQIFDLDDIKDFDHKLYNLDIIRDHIDSPEFLNNIKQLAQSTINKKFIGEKN
ncbi:metallophosphoesterase family protein [Companilactobacillus furfuricola]|uniref:metallophosphoesterase family protein n=1 Tax=Companilactobacillus furfuricola TaxID=1462575 RepID=UPI000F7AC309|nr:exonuclease SbcCD subunit D [Companilactobacillus furfuricola]